VAELQFQVFGGEFEHEPAGGMRDFLRSYADRFQAIAYAEGYMTGRGGSGGWARIYDSKLGREVWTDAEGTYGR
jgi:hypothetical protein